jgi:WD40 repeat protein
MRKTEFLLHDARLKEAKDWLKKYPNEIAPKEKDFINRSIRRANWLRTGVVVMMLSFVIVAGWQWVESVKAKTHAELMSELYLAQQEIMKDNPVNAISKVLKKALPKNFSEPKRPVTKGIETLSQALFELREHPLEHQEVIGVSEKYVAFVGENGKIDLSTRSDGQLAYMLGESTTEVNRVIFSSDSRKALGYSKDSSSNNTVYLWDIENRQVWRKLTVDDWKTTFDDESGSEADRLANAPNTKVSYANFIDEHHSVIIKLTKLNQNRMGDDSAKEYEYYYLWNLKADKLSGPCDVETDNLSCDGVQLEKPKETDQLPDNWRNGSSPLLMAQIEPTDGSACQMVQAAFDSDGKVVMTCQNQNAYQWQIPNSDKIQEPWAVIHGKWQPSDSNYRAVQNSTSKTVRSPDRKKTATIDRNNVMLQLENGQTHTLKIPRDDEYDQAWIPSVTLVTFSPDSQTLLIATNDYVVGLWNAENGQLTQYLKELSVSIHEATFIDNKIILVSEEHTVAVWDISTDSIINMMNFENFENITQISVSPDGQKVMTLFDNGMVNIWRLFLEPQELVDFANKVVPRDPSSEQ